MQKKRLAKRCVCLLHPPLPFLKLDVRRLLEKFYYPARLSRMPKRMLVDVGGGDGEEENEAPNEADAAKEGEEEKEKNHYSTKLTERERRLKCDRR